MFALRKKRKGQFFSYDAIVAGSIFVLVLGIFLFYWWGITQSISFERDDMQSEASRLGDTLLTPGNPASWAPNCQTALSIGLAANYSSTNVIDRSKIDALNNSCIDSFRGPGYNSTQQKLKITYDYELALANSTGYIYRMPANSTNLPTARNVVTSERIVLFNNQTAVLRVTLYR